mmetsp:Transcript_73775/g.191602  ORF Transcript_73775/g.191602 Transcript_73775/m.191602 type:complete len:249 (-) Transcript_73775:1719-2465(-)
MPWAMSDSGEADADIALVPRLPPKSDKGVSHGQRSTSRPPSTSLTTTSLSPAVLVSFNIMLLSLTASDTDDASCSPTTSLAVISFSHAAALSRSMRPISLATPDSDDVRPPSSPSEEASNCTPLSRASADINLPSSSATMDSGETLPSALAASVAQSPARLSVEAGWAAWALAVMLAEIHWPISSAISESGETEAENSRVAKESLLPAEVLRDGSAVEPQAPPTGETASTAVSIRDSGPCGTSLLLED